jgi:hypothetical protein
MTTLNGTLMAMLDETLPCLLPDVCGTTVRCPNCFKRVPIETFILGEMQACWHCGGRDYQDGSDPHQQVRSFCSVCQRTGKTRGPGLVVRMEERARILEATDPLLGPVGARIEALRLEIGGGR